MNKAKRITTTTEGTDKAPWRWCKITDIYFQCVSKEHELKLLMVGYGQWTVGCSYCRVLWKAQVFGLKTVHKAEGPPGAQAAFDKAFPD